MLIIVATLDLFNYLPTATHKYFQLNRIGLTMQRFWRHGNRRKHKTYNNRLNCKRIRRSTIQNWIFIKPRLVHIEVVYYFVSKTFFVLSWLVLDFSHFGNCLLYLTIFVEILLKSLIQKHQDCNFIVFKF